MAITQSFREYNAETKSMVEIKNTYAQGCVLRKWYGSVQVMSDVWETSLFAQYWDEETATVKVVNWINEATVDASDEVIAKAKQWMYSQAYDRILDKRVREAAEEAQRIVKGSRVKVVSGRTGKGLEGPVVVTIEKPYRAGYRSWIETKVGIAKSELMVKVTGRNGKTYDSYKDIEWVWARNCQLLEIPSIDLGSIRKSTKDEADREIAGCGF